MTPCATCHGRGDVFARRVEPLNVGRLIGKVVDISPQVGVARAAVVERMPCPDCGGSGVPASPCVGRCALDDAAVCRGCARTVAEIAGWGAMGDAEKRRVLERIAAAAGTGRAVWTA